MPKVTKSRGGADEAATAMAVDQRPTQRGAEQSGAGGVLDGVTPMPVFPPVAAAAVLGGSLKAEWRKARSKIFILFT